MKHPQKPTRHEDSDDEGQVPRAPRPIISHSSKSDKPPGPNRQQLQNQSRRPAGNRPPQFRTLREWWRSMQKEKKAMFAECDRRNKKAQQKGAWMCFGASCVGTLAGLIIFCLVCSFLSLFTSRGKTQVADTKVKTVSSPKKTAAPQPKVEATPEEQTTEPEPTQPNVSEELPPAAAAAPEEPDVTAPVERVILKIVADEEIRFLGLKGDRGPPGVSVSLFYDKQVIAQTKVGKKGTFNFYFDAPQLVPKEGKLEVRCTLPEDQKVSAVLNVSIFKNEDGVQQEKKPTYDSKTDLFRVKLK